MAAGRGERLEPRRGAAAGAPGPEDQPEALLLGEVLEDAGVDVRELRGDEGARSGGGVQSVRGAEPGGQRDRGGVRAGGVSCQLAFRFAPCPISCLIPTLRIRCRRLPRKPLLPRPLLG